MAGKMEIRPYFHRRPEEIRQHDQEKSQGNPAQHLDRQRCDLNDQMILAIFTTFDQHRLSPYHCPLPRQRSCFQSKIIGEANAIYFRKDQE